MTLPHAKPAAFEASGLVNLRGDDTGAVEDLDSEPLNVVKSVFFLSPVDVAVSAVLAARVGPEQALAVFRADNVTDSALEPDIFEGRGGNVGRGRSG